MTVGALGQLSSYDGGVQAVSDVSLIMSSSSSVPVDPQDPVSHDSSLKKDNLSHRSRSSSIRCAWGEVGHSPASPCACTVHVQHEYIIPGAGDDVLMLYS